MRYLDNNAIIYPKDCQKYKHNYRRRPECRKCLGSGHLIHISHLPAQSLALGSKAPQLDAVQLHRWTIMHLLLLRIEGHDAY